MKAKRKMVSFGRHGRAPQKPEGGSYDRLQEGTIEEIYKNVGVPLYERVQEYGIKPERTFLRYSGKERAKQTAQAVLVGAFNMQPTKGENPPKTPEDLGNYDFSAIDTAKDPRLIHPTVNLDVYKSEGGLSKCVDYLLEHPDAEEQEGVAIESGRSVDKRVGDVLRDYDGILNSDGKDFGVLGSHAGLVDAIAIALINTERNTPVKRIAEIGGPFDMAEFAHLIIDQTKGGIYTATLELKGKEYKVDLDKIMS